MNLFGDRFVNLFGDFSPLCVGLFPSHGDSLFLENEVFIDKNFFFQSNFRMKRHFFCTRKSLANPSAYLNKIYNKWPSINYVVSVGVGGKGSEIP